MKQGLKINEKKYLPSTELSKEFGYTSDYISKMAREERILATRIGRQWFVEPESLKTFALQASIEKKNRKDSLRRQRVVERSVKNTTSEDKGLRAIQKGEAHSLLLSSAVLCCGLLVGLLSWSVSSSDLQPHDLVGGVEFVGSMLSEAVLPDINFFIVRGESTVNESNIFPSVEKLDSHYMTAAAVDSMAEETEVVFTVFPQFPEREELLSFDFNEMSELSFGEIVSPESIAEYFSDEVLVEVKDGVYIVQPVFRDSLGEIHEFVLMPPSNNDHGN